MGHHGPVKQTVITIGCLLFGLLLGFSTAQADMAVLIQITDQSVILARVERNDSENVLTEEEATEQFMRDLAAPKTDLPSIDDKLVVSWYDAQGGLVHQEVLRDPRFVHAPGSEERVLPEATLLLRAPNEAVLLRVKPRKFSQFIDLNV